MLVSREGATARPSEDAKTRRREDAKTRRRKCTSARASRVRVKYLFAPNCTTAPLRPQAFQPGCRQDLIPWKQRPRILPPRQHDRRIVAGRFQAAIEVFMAGDVFQIRQV